jgi:hypothetical protein
MTKTSVCIHALRESLACEGLTDANPYAGDIIVACVIFVGILLVALVTVFYLTQIHRSKWDRRNNDKIRYMTQAEINRRR